MAGDIGSLRSKSYLNEILDRTRRSQREGKGEILHKRAMISIAGDLEQFVCHFCAAFAPFTESSNGALLLNLQPEEPAEQPEHGTLERG